jgi:hypothetical protein
MLTLALPAQADPPSRDGSLPTRPDVRAGSVDAPRSSLTSCPTLRLPRLADLEPERDSLLRQVTLTELPPGSLVVEYQGVQGFLARRLQSRYRSLWRSQIDLLYDETSMTDAERSAALDEIGTGFADLRGGRWWERSWRESLLPEKGGAPARPWVHVVGQDLELFRLGAVSVTNELKVRVDRLAVLSLDAAPGLVYREREEISEPSRVARDNARLTRAMVDPEDEARRPVTSRSPVGQVPLLEPFVGLELAPARTIFMEGVSWRFKVRPLVRLRLPSDLGVDQLAEFARSLSLRLSADMHLGQREQRVLSLELGLTYHPPEGDLEVRGELALVSW